MSETNHAAAGSVPLAGQIKCVEREIAYRKRLYPRWVEQGKYDRAELAYELEAMQSVLATLGSLRRAEEFALDSDPVPPNAGGSG